MTAPDPSPYLVVDRPCDGCDGVYQATGGHAEALRGTAAHRILMRCGSPSEAQRGELTALASEAAEAAGWLTGGRTWRCPRCRGRYGDTGVPRRYTVRELIALHRA